MDVLLAKASGAATAEFEVGSVGRDAYRQVPTTLFLVGSVATGKAVTVEYNSESTTWVQCKIEGELIQLDADNNVLTLYGRAKLRVSRADDAGTVGVLIA